MVLGIDTLAAQGVSFLFDWRILLRFRLGGFDSYKFVAWFVIPFLVALFHLDKHAFTFKRWERKDVYILTGLVTGGGLVIVVIPFIPGVSQLYRGYGHLSAVEKQDLVFWYLSWTVSWLVGWEFLHRYVLLRAWDTWLPRIGWLIVPLFEGVYHLQKPLIEALGMAALSLVLTGWARKRNNVLLPFLVHLAIELELLAFLLLAS
jgi:membrane protease YdiL (CAAX protease family)